MPITEHDKLDPGFEKRLKAALDSAIPPSPLLSSARYRSLTAWPGRPWRLAPALVAIGAAGMALTAAAATGSPNPAVWTERAGSVIQFVSHVPAATPKAARTPRPEPSHGNPSGGTGGGHPTPSTGREQEASPGPEPTERPEASPQPEPSPSPHDSPEPSPTPDGSGGQEPTPTPTQDDHSGGS
jgi:hypothetical protein